MFFIYLEQVSCGIISNLLRLVFSHKQMPVLKKQILKCFDKYFFPSFDQSASQKTKFKANSLF